MLRLNRVTQSVRHQASNRSLSLGNLNSRANPALANGGRSSRSNAAIVRAPERAIPLPPAHERARFGQTPLEHLPEWLMSWGVAKHANAGLVLRRLYSKTPGGFGGFTKNKGSNNSNGKASAGKSKDAKTGAKKDAESASNASSDKTKVKGSGGGAGGGTYFCCRFALCLVFVLLCLVCLIGSLLHHELACHADGQGMLGPLVSRYRNVK
jgi:hypothetical protein